MELEDKPARFQCFEQLLSLSPAAQQPLTAPGVAAVSSCGLFACSPVAALGLLLSSSLTCWTAKRDSRVK